MTASGGEPAMMPGEAVPDTPGTSGRDIPGPVPGTTRFRFPPMPLVVGFLALVPRLLTVGRWFNNDERLWMERTVAFSDALTSGDLAGMSATMPRTGTMPGIGTVWTGSLGRLLWGTGRALGIVDGGGTFASTASGYTSGQVAMAIVTSCLIGLLAWLVARWMSPRVGFVAAAVFAVEPWWVGLGSMLHTDELLTLCGMTGIVTIAWALGLPDPARRPVHPTRWVMVGAGLVILAGLTKLNGLGFAPPAALLFVWALVRAVRARPPGVSPFDAGRPVLRLGLFAIAAVLVTTVVSYPAMLFDLSGQIDALRVTMDISGTKRYVFFGGRVVHEPGPAFYPVTLAYHATLWVSILVPVGVVVALARRVSRPYAITMLVSGLVPGLGLGASSLAYPRYGMVILGPVTLAAAAALQPTPGSVRTERIVTFERVSAVAVAAAFLFSLHVAPWGNLTFNPVLSALRPPDDTLRVGWNEAVYVGVPVIERDLHARGLECRGTAVNGPGPVPLTHACAIREAPRAAADYVVVEMARLQTYPWLFWTLDDDFDLVENLTVRGNTVGQLWRRKGLAP